MKRNRPAPPAQGSVDLAPRHWRRGESLPPFRIHTPPGGWTLQAAALAALRYSDAHALGRPGAAAAFRAIAGHFDPSLRRAEIRARILEGDALAPKEGGRLATE